MNIEPAFTVLRREQLLIDHSPHSTQFENLTEQLLRAFSAAAVIPTLTAEEIRLYAALALLHDVGKRAIPQEILNKPGHLTREEFEVMKSHTTQGCELLEQIPELRKCEAFPAICDVCRHHHERWDGSGYPDRLAGEDSQEPEEPSEEPAEEPVEVIDPGPSFQELWDTPIQVIGMDEALRHLRTIVAQTEPHPAMTTDFADYTVSEALLLLLLLSAFMAACIKMLKGGFAWLR